MAKIRARARRGRSAAPDLVSLVPSPLGKLEPPSKYATHKQREPALCFGLPTGTHTDFVRRAQRAMLRLEVCYLAPVLLTPILVGVSRAENLPSLHLGALEQLRIRCTVAADAHLLEP